MSKASTEVEDHLAQDKIYAKLSRNYQQWQSTTTSIKTTREIPVVLVSTGSYNPIHLHHVQVFQEAKTRLELEGYTCLAGFLSPSHNCYVRHKLKQSHVIPSRHRFHMIQAAVQDSDWLSAHPWEMSQDGFIDFGPTLHAIRFSNHAWLGDDTVQVRYLCGMDHALKCQLLGSSYGASLGLVALARPGSQRDSSTSILAQPERYKQQGILVLQDDSLLDAETASASSTAVRKAIATAPRERIAFLDVRVETYLRQNAKDIGGIYGALVEPQT